MEEVDLIVVGSGVAGLTTALVGAISGLRVLILEKTGMIGGATAYAAGGAFLPGCHHLPPEPNAAAPLTYIEHCTAGRMNREMVEAYLANGPAALALLEANTEVRFQASPALDYHMNVPGASASPRTVMPVAFDGSTLGKGLRLLRPPLPAMTILGGMQVDYRDIDILTRVRTSPSSMLYAAKLLAGHWLGLLRYRRSPRLVFGNALVGRLLKSVQDRARDITLHVGAAATNLIMDGTRVAGVEYERHGRRVIARARTGVMLACGGFPGNAAMRAERTPFAEFHKSLPPLSNSGDGIAMALRVGARLMENTLADFCYAPVSHMLTPHGEERLFPHFAFDRCRPGAIAVGADGMRFVNEGCVYSDFVPAMHAARAVPAFLICDHRFLRKYGLGMVLPAPFSYRSFVRHGYLTRADSIPALASTLGVDVDGLIRSVKRNNDYARTGEDLDFGKGHDAYSRSMGDPANKPNPCLGPIERPPYYAIRLYPGDTATTCGLVVNVRGQVLDEDDRPIPGLFAAGPDMANPTLGSNPSGGCNIGPAMTFGYLAAMRMAGRMD